MFAAFVARLAPVARRLHPQRVGVITLTLLLAAASILGSAAAVPSKTPDIVIMSYGSATCTGTPSSVYGMVSETCQASTSTSSKITANTPPAYNSVTFAGTECAGTAASTTAFTADGTTCTATSGSTAIKMGSFGSAATAATDLTFGFYSDATCDTGVGLTASGGYGYLNGASGTCLPLPTGGTSAKIEYTAAKMDVSLYLTGTGKADCGVTGSSAATGVISGAPGTCEELLTTGLAAAQAASYCPGTGKCYIYVFPAGAVAPGSSGASSATLAAVTAAGAVAAAVLLA